MSRVYLDVVIGDAPAGRIVLQLETKMCPKTSENFIQIAKGFTTAEGKTLTYKDTIFHRIIPNFMIQFGDVDVKYTDADLSKAGFGGESIYGPTFNDENFHLDFDEKYLLAMANCGRNTNGSQVFITVRPTACSLAFIRYASYMWSVVASVFYFMCILFKDMIFMSPCPMQ